MLLTELRERRRGRGRVVHLPIRLGDDACRIGWKDIISPNDFAAKLSPQAVMYGVIFCQSGRLFIFFRHQPRRKKNETLWCWQVIWPTGRHLKEMVDEAVLITASLGTPFYSRMIYMEAAFLNYSRVAVTLNEYGNAAVVPSPGVTLFSDRPL